MSDRPPEIESALSALEILSSDVPHDEFMRLKKTLPALARQMAQAGEDVNAETLIAHVCQGEEHLADLKEKYAQKHKPESLSYAEIVKKLNLSQKDLNEKLKDSIASKDIDGVREWLDQGAEVTQLIFTSAGESSVEIVALLCEHIDDFESLSEYALSNALHKENIPVAEFLLSKGAKIEDMFYGRLNNWNGVVKKFVVQTGIDFVHEHCDEILGVPVRLRKIDECSFYVDECGVNPEFLSENLFNSYKNLVAWSDFHTDVDIPARSSVRHYPPYHFDESTFKAVQAMLTEEGYTHDEDNNVYAYQASSLFKSERRVLEYLQKWGRTGKQPLHDIIQDLKIPKTGRPDLKAWGDAVMKHGPKMARYVKFSDRLVQPFKDGSGGWSYTKTKEEIAKYAFNRGDEYPLLAKFCLDQAWESKDFEAALKQIDKFQAKYNPSGSPEAANDNIKGGAIPDITIDGKRFYKEGYTFRKLPDGDVRGLLLGEFTNCCQHLAHSIGDVCAKHGFLSEHAGFYIVEDNDTGDIVAQSWAWRGRNGELVLDSLESLSGHFNAEKWTSLCQIFSEKISATLQETDITALHIGRGGATPKKLRFEKSASSAKPLDYKGYRDSYKQYLVATYS